MANQSESDETTGDGEEKRVSEVALRALGWAVRKRRDALNLSQESLGEKAGVHRNYVGGVERGEQNPSYLNLRKLAAGLDLSLAELAERAEAELATLPK